MVEVVAVRVGIAVVGEEVGVGEEVKEEVKVEVKVEVVGEVGVEVGVVGVDTVEVGVGVDEQTKKATFGHGKIPRHDLRNVPREVVGVKKAQVKSVPPSCVFVFLSFCHLMKTHVVFNMIYIPSHRLTPLFFMMFFMMPFLIPFLIPLLVPFLISPLIPNLMPFLGFVHRKRSTTNVGFFQEKWRRFFVFHRGRKGMAAG